ncbi:PepSY domain-containing protein [Ureibacillus sp. NPDC094379]
MKKYIISALAVGIIAGGGYTFVNADIQDSENQAELAKQAEITEQDATKIALEKVPGKVNEVELENEDGLIVYEFEIVGEDGSEQDLEVDAKTGEIVKVEADDEENDDLSQAELVKQAKITKDEASEKALVQVPGTVTEVELEDEDGLVVYDVEINAEDGTQQSVQVDAKTGKIVNVELEDNDDNKVENNNQK